MGHVYTLYNYYNYTVYNIHITQKTYSSFNRFTPCISSGLISTLDMVLSLHSESCNKLWDIILIVTESHVKVPQGILQVEVVVFPPPIC